MRARSSAVRRSVCAGLLLFCTLLPSNGSAAAAQADARGTEPRAAGRGIAILPLHNRTGEAVPIGRVRDALVARLAERGLPILDRAALDKFMRRHRVRHTGGIDRETARALRAETGARAVLITSLDLYAEGDSPKVGLTSRLVSTTEVPWVLWMDSAVETGDESPGILGLGLIDDPEVVLDHVASRLMDSLVATASSASRGGPDDEGPAGGTAKRFRPKVAYSSPDGSVSRTPRGRIAVLPIANESAARYAGEILADQLVRHLAAAGEAVVEPGIVRKVMLEARQIQPQGPSVPQVDILRVSLNAEVLIYGQVERYREAGPATREPALAFSLRAIDTASRQVVWSSVSHTEGNDGVFFFDVGQIATAHELASKLAQAIVQALHQEGGVLARPSEQRYQALAELALVAEDADEISRLLDAATAERTEIERQAAAARDEAARALVQKTEMEERLHESRKLREALARQLAERAAAGEEAAGRLVESERREAMLRDSAESLETLLVEARRRAQQLEGDLAASRAAAAAVTERLEAAEARIAELETSLRALESALAEARQPAQELADELDLPPDAGPTVGEVESAVRAWASAWADQRVDDYLASYSQDFRPTGGRDLGAWRALRRQRLSRPSFIEVGIEALRVRFAGRDTARASFRQTYRSDIYADAVDKILELRREPEGWKIVRESVR